MEVIHVKRCSWVNLDNPKYVKYHDFEWGVATYDDRELFELLVLEMFQAGLSWETILNKRENFRKAIDNFDVAKIASYDLIKINSLMNDAGIIRNRRKIDALINNAKVFMEIQKEWGSFSNYIWHFTDGKVIISTEFHTTNALSDEVSLSLKKYGMSFVGSTIIYSYLEAIGVLNNHESDCYKRKCC